MSTSSVGPELTTPRPRVAHTNWPIQTPHLSLSSRLPLCWVKFCRFLRGSPTHFLRLFPSIFFFIIYLYTYSLTQIPYKYLLLWVRGKILLDALGFCDQHLRISVSFLTVMVWRLCMSRVLNFSENPMECSRGWSRLSCLTSGLKGN